MASLQLRGALAGPDTPLRAPRVDQKRKNKFAKFMEWVIPKMEAELGSNFRWKRPINCFAPPTSLVWAIRDDHVISFLNHLGFGIEEPKKRDLSTKKYASSTLWDYKGDISVHHPAGQVKWRYLQSGKFEGNPAISDRVKGAIKDLERCEGLGLGADGQDQRPLMLAELHALLETSGELEKKEGTSETKQVRTYKWAVRTE